MQAEHLITFATFFALVWSLGALLGLFCPAGKRTWRLFIYAALSLVALAAVLWADSLISLGRNSVVFIIKRLLAADPHHFCAAGLGLSIGLGPALWPWQDHFNSSEKSFGGLLRKTAVLTAILFSFVFTGLLALEEKIKPLLRERGFGSIVSSPLGESTNTDFILEEFHQCGFQPVQIAIGPDGALYATGYKGPIHQNGMVARLAENSETGNVTETQIARNLNRPHGLAFYKGDLYVSRSGHHMRAEAGSMVGVDTGAVTLIRDFDNDGIMDYYEDVLADLPGVQGPDQLHQNNGIAFDSEGYLYTTIGVHSNRAPSVGKYEGTILRCRPDGSKRTVFARGFRNSFDLVFGPDGALFATDNDAGDGDSGEELNHVIKDAHYGFPYADAGTKHPEGTIAPLLVARKGSYQGLAYTNSPKLPEKYRNCLYMVNYGSGEILQVRLIPEGSTYRAEPTVFAIVPGALDIAIDDNGVIYVSCFESSRIFRLTYQGER